MTKRSLAAGAMSVLLGMGASAATSCVRLDEGHCILNGGDFACGEGWMCVTEIMAVAEPTDQGDGCISIQDIDYDLDAYFVHVQYGLPSRLRAQGEARDDLQSVTGILVRAVEEREAEDHCIVQESVVRSVEPQWLEVEEVRAFLDRRTRIRAATADLDPAHVQAIDDFNAAVNELLDECGASAPEG